MSITSELHNLYRDCVNCPNTDLDCPGIWRDVGQGVIPRGFYFDSAPIDVLVVGKNPGHPSRDKRYTFAGYSGDQLYQRHRKFRDDFFKNEKWSEQKDTFSRNLAEYLTFILDVDETDIFSRVAFTNLVKCSTQKESAKLFPQTMEKCFFTYLIEEVSLLKPKVILALGREAEEFLLRKSWRYLKVPVIYIKHPSYHYKREQEANELKKIKEEICYFLDKGGLS